MASRDSSSDSDDGVSPESRILRRHYYSLMQALTTADRFMFTANLVAGGIISHSVMEEANNPTLTRTRMSSVLLSAIESSVEAKPKLFKKFVKLLKEERSGILDEMAGKLESTLSKYSSTMYISMYLAGEAL